MKNFLAVFILLSSYAFGQAVSAAPIGIDRNGNPAVTQVTVCTTNPGGGTCGSLVTLYTTNTLATACTGTGTFLSSVIHPNDGSTCSNPGFTDSSGNVVAFAAAGAYWCQFATPGPPHSVPCAVSGTAGGGVSGSGTANLLTKWTSSTAIGNSQVTDDGTHADLSGNGFDIGTASGYQWQIANNTSTGTTANKMACDDGSGKAIICPAANAAIDNPFGVAVSGVNAAPGITGNTSICLVGFCTVIFDNSATARHYAQVSTSVDGDLTDVGTTVPTNAQPFYFIVTGNSGAGTSAVIRDLTGDEAAAAQGGGGNPVRGLSFTIGDPAGAALTAGDTTTDYLTIPFGCKIKGWNLNITAGTVTVKFWKIASGTAIPTSANSINTSGVSISSGTAIHSTTLTDFTTKTIAANDIMAMNVTAVATTPYVNGVLQCQ